MRADVGHIHTPGYIVHVTRPSTMLGKLEDCGAMGYLMEYKYDSGYHVWITCIGMREVRDITFYEETAPVLPGDGSVTEVQQEQVQDLLPLKLMPSLPATHTNPTPTQHSTESVSNSDNKESALPGGNLLYVSLTEDHADHILTNLVRDQSDDPPQYVGQVPMTLKKEQHK